MGVILVFCNIIAKLEADSCHVQVKFLYSRLNVTYLRQHKSVCANKYFKAEDTRTCFHSEIYHFTSLSLQRLRRCSEAHKRHRY